MSTEALGEDQTHDEHGNINFTDIQLSTHMIVCIRKYRPQWIGKPGTAVKFT